MSNAAATAKTLEHQAKAMDERVAFFKLDNAALDERPAAKPAVPMLSRGPAAPKKQPVAAPKRVAAGANGSGPVRCVRAALATAVNSDPDWKEF